MKNVLWLVSWYPSRVDAFNGDFIQRHAMAVASFCQVHVIYVVKAAGKALPVQQEENMNGNLTETVIYYKSPKTGISFLDRILSQRKYNQCYKRAIKDYINKKGLPALVHVHIAMKAGLAALWMKKKWNILFVVTENWTGYYRQSLPSLYDYNWLLRKLHKKILQQASLFFPVTNDLGQTVKAGFIDIPYEVVPNVVNTDVFYYKPYQQSIFRFIHFSYMNYQKNPEGMLEAARRLRDKGYEFELVMTGNKEQTLINLVNNTPSLHGVVHFNEAVPYHEVAGQMQQASAFLLFSRFENLPCVMLEALCCGLPVISSRVGGIAEVVNRENGILVESENINELTDAMQHMIDNYKAYDKAGIAAQAVSKFNYNQVGEQYFAAYNSMA
jgi:glycosyltransferase involved in cell wall biosynthesis